MTREEVNIEMVESNNNVVIAELPTSYGKSKMALDRLARFYSITSGLNVLIVVPRLVLINNWIDEFKKWGYENYLDYVTFSTYVSFPKKAIGRTWDMIIFDEGHHLSERCRDAMEDVLYKQAIVLSATLNRNIKQEMAILFPKAHKIKVTAKDAIEENVLPNPKVILIPMYLNNTAITHQIIKNNSCGNDIVVPYSQRFKFSSIKNRRIIITCTQRQYYDDLSSKIDWFKKKMSNEIFKNMYLRHSGERLKWLSNEKTQFVKSLLATAKLKQYRTLTFCNGIQQTEQLGKHCINSKNTLSRKYLDSFNAKKIKHITACNVLDEGVNLVDCQVGIYACLNNSDRMIVQKMGRLLRHKEPIIIIPYYKFTRDEELVMKMLLNYDAESVITLENPSKINEVL